MVVPPLNIPNLAELIGPYPHDLVIRGWLDGKTVQLKDPQVGWVDLPSRATVTKMPHFYRADEYRLKPQVLRVREALLRGSNGGIVTAWIVTCNNLAEAQLTEKSPHFDRWLEDWREELV